MKSPNAKRTATRKLATREMRWQLCLEIGRCEVCGRKRGAQNLAVHELARGTSRQAALDKRYAVLVVCSLICHEQVQVEPLTKQLARLYLNRASDLDLVSFNRLRNRADGAITFSDLARDIEALLGGGEK
jgi:hypothetical protein